MESAFHKMLTKSSFSVVGHSLLGLRRKSYRPRIARARHIFVLMTLLGALGKMKVMEKMTVENTGVLLHLVWNFN